MATRYLARLIACTAVALASCGTLPDAKPFADATSSLAASVGPSGKAITDSMAEAGSVVPSDQATYDALIKSFNTAWRARVAAIQGAATYSESIANLVDAGKKGGEAAGDAADALRSLVESAGIPIAAPAFGVAADLVRFLAERIAIVRASASLEAATARAQPAVDRVAEQIVADIDSGLRPILQSAYKNVTSGIKSGYEEDDNFDQQLRRRRTKLRVETQTDAAKRPELQALDVSQAHVAVSLAERDRKLDQAAAAYRTRRALLDALSSATLSWAQAHRDLAVAIQDKRKVSVAELVATIEQLKALTRKVREL